MDPLIGPVVVPIRARRQINHPAGSSLLGDRGHQKRRSKHVLIAQAGNPRVVRKVHKKRPHIGCACLLRVVRQRIDVGNQLIAQLEIFLENRFRLPAVGPHFVVGAAAVRPKNGKERRILKPAGVEFRIIIVTADIRSRIGRIEQRRVQGMMFLGQILPPPDVVGPIRHARSGEVETRRNLPLQGVPGGIDIRRPEHGATALRSQVSVPREDERATGNVPAKAIVDRRGVQQGIDVVITRPRPDLEVAAIGRQVRLGFIRPNGVEALADDIVANHIPVPASGLGIGGINIGAGAVIGQPIGGCAVRELLEPALLRQEVVIARTRRESGPDADHRLEAQVVKLPVHAPRIRPLVSNEIHLPHLREVEPVDHDDVGRQVPLPVALGNGQHFRLGRVALFALDVPVGSLWQQRRGARKLPVPGIDFICRRAGNDKEGHAVADLRTPERPLVESRLDGRLRGIIPNDPVPVVRNHEGHADAGAAGSCVVMPAFDRMAAMV